VRKIALSTGRAGMLQHRARVRGAMATAQGVWANDPLSPAPHRSARADLGISVPVDQARRPRLLPSLRRHERAEPAAREQPSDPTTNARRGGPTGHRAKIKSRRSPLDRTRPTESGPEALSFPPRYSASKGRGDHGGKYFFY
jgi:hypothetical protein